MHCRLELDDALKLVISPKMVPVSSFLPQGLTPIIPGPRHISLVSRRGMRPLVKRLGEVDLSSIEVPTPIFGTPRVVYRPATDTREEMACLCAPLQNQEEIRAFVNALFQQWGLKNPEPRFVYHLTLANNAGGNPRGSIAYNNPSDFAGPPQHDHKAFTPRPSFVVAPPTTPSLRIR